MTFLFHDVLDFLHVPPCLFMQKILCSGILSDQSLMPPCSIKSPPAAESTSVGAVVNPCG